MSLITIGQVVDESILHYRKHFASLMTVSLWLFAGLPFIILGLALKPADTTALSPAYVASLVLGIAGSVISGVMGLWTLTALILTVKTQVDEKRLDAKAISKTAWKLFFRMLGVSISIVVITFAVLLLIVPGAALTIMPAIINIPTILSGVGVFLFFVGGVLATIVLAWLMVTLIFAPYAAVLESTSVIGAIQRARLLVENRWWAVMFRVLIPKLIIFVIVFFVEYVLIQLIILLLASMGNLSEGGAILIYEIVKNLSLTGISALLVPMLVIADYYVFRSLVATEGQNAT